MLLTMLGKACDASMETEGPVALHCVGFLPVS